MKLRERDEENFRRGEEKGRSEGLREGRSEGLLYMIRMTRALMRQENGTDMLKELPEEDAKIAEKIVSLIRENENLSDKDILENLTAQVVII